jgi:hypothetical protein
MLSLKEYNKSKTVKGLVQKMFEARQTAHECHLKTKSYAEHKALGEFYDNLLDFVDEFVETYQGQYGILSDYEFQTQSVSNPVEYLEECAKIFVASRETVKDAHLQNIIDEVVALTYRAIYKLKFLK